MPVYNSNRFLGESIQSVLQQSYKNIELIIVDDGSTDGSLQTAKQFEKFGVKIFSQKNRGAASARNKGLSLATGSFIQYLDADDLLETNKITIQMQVLKNDTKSIAFGDCINFKEQIYSENTILNSHYCRDIKTTEKPDDFIIKMNGGISDLPTGMVEIHSWLCPKNIIEEAGPWNEKLTVDDDGEFFLRVILNSRRIHYLPKSLTYYRKYNDNSSLSNNTGKKNLTASIDSLKSKADILLRSKSAFVYKKIMSDYFWQLAIRCYPDEYDLYEICAKKAIKILGRKKLPKFYIGNKFIDFLANTLSWKLARRLQYIKQKIT
ncbi:glycosyltransferase [Pedobacter rhodius]|uniref:Glycosyltransferase n=1 Tax=Pedobacter rhodius TaxID=3004098 RepID=A0ABT4KS90_9SPHI|nr:glycosyltransferase [Pedobacter sp. SJ11]MCZ4221799.1 glycosyltransferase [Pedobacter sp. SJ11]